MRNDDLCELGVVKTATPCKVGWDSMRGEGAVRFCDQCRLNVYDFSQLTTNEARELLLQKEGRLCARIFTREDGTILTRDCPTAVTRKTRRRVGGAVAAAALLGAGVAAALAPEKQCEVAAQSAGRAAAQPAPLRSANQPGEMLGGL